uniref:Uncharacterized protein n=1 Tax=Timema genevievae TaxID=629358 RepID=A0A7R9K9U4_TIMGE|nr:unnamed protein product [Timema genevievae]
MLLGAKQDMSLEAKQGMSLGAKQDMSLGAKQDMSLGAKQDMFQGDKQDMSQGAKQGMSQGAKQGMSLGAKQDMSQGAKQGMSQGAKQGMYLDLTEEEKEKLRGSYKVARKLDKLDKDRYSGFLSPRTPTSEPPSLTEHMQLMDEVLADGRMAKLEKIERLEAILSAAAVAVSSSHLDSSPGVHAQSLLRSSEDGLCCLCDCHHEALASTAPPSSLSRRGGIGSEVACQTLSTGDIVITRIFFTEEEKDLEKTLLASPKREVRKETS